MSSKGGQCALVNGVHLSEGLGETEITLITTRNVKLEQPFGYIDLKDEGKKF